jgi:methyl-accepting chemotaxis protein
VTSEEDLKAQRERELAELQDELNKLTSHFEMMELNMKKYTAGIKTMIEEGEQQALLNTKEEDSYRIKKGTLDLLPQADENIAKLKGLIQANSDRIVKLVGKWEEIRAPLVAELRELKSKSDLTEIQSQELLEEIRMLRERMKEIADETKYKDDLYKQLVGEYERMSKDTSRSSYTKRIMEIIANIKKQTEEINKILKDTKHVQKEINQLSGKLDRVFQVTDEQVFKVFSLPLSFSLSPI